MFQSTLPRGERQPVDEKELTRLKVSIHAPARGATRFKILKDFAQRFQSTLPRGERPHPVALRRVGVEVSIHAPARGATTRGVSSRGCLPRFNPRSREGSDLGWHSTFERAQFQSTLPRGERRVKLRHKVIRSGFQSTLPRGERRARYCSYAPEKPVSIHAPARGATSWQHLTKPRQRFQSTLPRGERLHAPDAHKIAATVSIHAPARGATRKCRHQLNGGAFQSTLPRGERPGRRFSCSDFMFQSTLPRGERRIVPRREERGGRFNPRSREGSDARTSTTPERSVCFNPRSREGSDVGAIVQKFVFRVSIHAPARGATAMQGRQRSRSCFNPRSREGSDAANNGPWVTDFDVSIHAPARGATVLALAQLNRATVSIHAPARGATPTDTPASSDRRFQSTLPRGERRIAGFLIPQNIAFQSTLPRGERRRGSRGF